MRGQDNRIRMGNQDMEVRVIGVEPPNKIVMMRRVHGAMVAHTIGVDAFSPQEKVAFTTGMPVEGRALYAALLAWEGRQFAPFQQFSGMAGPLGAQVVAEAVERARAEHARASETAVAVLEARRAQVREAARVRVAGTKNRTWERFDEERVTRIRCDVVNLYGSSGAGTAATPIQTEGFHYIRMVLNRDCPLRIEIWKGGHTWCPSDVFDRAMDWMEQVTFLDPPRPAVAYSFIPNVRVEAEHVHPVAYKWFYDLTLRRAREAPDATHRFHHLSRLQTIATHGRLHQDTTVADSLREAADELRNLQGDPGVTRGIAAERAYQEFVTRYADHERRLQRKQGTPIMQGYVHSLSSAEMRAGREALAAGEIVVTNFPDTPQGRYLRGFLPGLEVELSKWP